MTHLSIYERMSSPTEREKDMLDLAAGITKTSRLGCQTQMRPELDGLVVRLPHVWA